MSQHTKENKNCTIGRTVASGLTWVFVQTGSLQIVSLFTTIILARLLDPSVFGLVAMTTLFMEFAQNFTDQGMGAAIVQREDLRPEHLDSVFWMNMGMSVMLVLVGFFLAGPISRMFNEPDLVPVFHVLLLNLPICAVNLVQRSLLQRNMEFRSLTLPTMVSALLGAITGISMALLGMGVWSLVAQCLVLNISTIPLFWHASKWRPRLRFSVAHFREIFSFSIYVMLTSLLYLANKKIDRLLIGLFMGTAALGVYSIALRLAETLDGTINKVVSTIFFPIMSKIQYDRASFLLFLHKYFRLVGLITIPIYVGLSLIAADLVPLLYGAKWIEGVPILQVMSFFFLVQAIIRVNNTAITAAGNPKIILWLHIFSTLIQVVVIYFAAQKGLVFVSIAFVLRAYTLFPLYLLAMQHTVKFKLKSFLSAIYPPVGGVCLMILAVLGLRWGLSSCFTDKWTSLILTIMISTATYTVGVMCVAPQWGWSMAKKAVLFAFARYRTLSVN